MLELFPFGVLESFPFVCCATFVLCWSCVCCGGVVLFCEVVFLLLWCGCDVLDVHMVGDEDAIFGVCLSVRMLVECCSWCWNCFYGAWR